MTSALANADQMEDNAMLPIELTNATGSYLQNLNDDCLIEIFSSKLLTSMDLTSLSETCTRLKQIAARIFAKDCSVSGVDFEGFYKINSKNCGKYQASVQDVERILKNFGSHISMISLCSDDRLVKMIAKYCRTTALKRLKIKYFVGSKGLTLKLKTIFERLEVLTFKSCDLMKVITCEYIDCASLIELEIYDSNGCVAVLRNTFPNLERFTFCGSRIFSQYNDNCSVVLLNFIRRHRRLKSLDVNAKSVYSSTELLHTIDDNCKELTELSLLEWNGTKTSFDFSSLKSMTKVTMLKMQLESINYPQLYALLAVLKSLRTVKLGGCEEPPFQLFIAMSQLQNLRQLHLQFFYFHRIPWEMLPQLRALFLFESLDEFSFAYLLQTIKQLKNLEELEYVDHWDNYPMFRLNNKDVSEIVRIVKRRPNVLTLRCRLSKNFWENCDKNENINLIEYKHEYDDDDDDDDD